MPHTFLYISLPLFCTTTTWNFQKLLGCTFYGGNVVRVLVQLFFHCPLIFTLHWWPLAFPILSPSLQNFHVVLPTKKMSPLFFISRSRPLSPFFSLSFAGLPPTFSFSLSFSCSIFQILVATIEKKLVHTFWWKKKKDNKRNAGDFFFFFKLCLKKFRPPRPLFIF